MTNLFLTLLAHILVLSIGASVFHVLDHLVRPQDAGVAEALVLVLALVALLWGVQEQLMFGQELIGEPGWPGDGPCDRPPAGANRVAGGRLPASHAVVSERRNTCREEMGLGRSVEVEGVPEDGGEWAETAPAPGRLEPASARRAGSASRMPLEVLAIG